jgi:quinol monooxygenase YgiN
MIYVVATIELNEGMRDQFLAAQKSLLPLVRAEEGCIEYTPTVDRPLDAQKTPPRPDVITMQEKWDTLDSLKAHSVAPHMAEFRPKTKHMIKNVKIEVFEST